jgi:peroxiredoxin
MQENDNSLPIEPVFENESVKESERIILPKGFQSGLGLAVAAFVFALLALGCFYFIIVAVAYGIAGIVLSIIHLAKDRPFKKLARWALVISFISILVSVVFSFMVFRGFYGMKNSCGSDHSEYIGTQAPELIMTDLNGNKIVLSELKGKKVIIDLWGTWCPPCVKEVPHFIKLRETIGTDELAIIGISTEPAETVRAFAEENNINYTVVAFEDELPDFYFQFPSLPTTIFIDKNGNIEDIASGYHSFEDLKEKALKPTPEIVIQSEPVEKVLN